MKASEYKCGICGVVVKRQSDKQWIKSLCAKTDKVTRIMRVKKKKKINPKS